MRLFFTGLAPLGEMHQARCFGTDQSFESCRRLKRRGTSSRSIDLKLISIVRVPLPVATDPQIEEEPWHYDPVARLVLLILNLT